MIRSIEIENFRCYRALKIENCAKLNVVVGDNGSGKTALLEAVFLALAASAEVSVRFRQQRGLDGLLGGTVKRIEDGLWGDLFHNYDWNRPIVIRLEGDGPEARRLEISRGGGESKLPFAASDLSQLVTTAPVTFNWTDSSGRSHVVQPSVAANGAITLPETGEDLPNFFFVPAAGLVGSMENATRFSELSKSNRQGKFIERFIGEFKWIKDLSIEVNTGSPAIFITREPNERKIPLANASMGINRMLSIMLSIASSPRSVVLVDEIENGIFHSHLSSMWKTIFALLDEYESQLFVSTHSYECLKALTIAAPERFDDMVLLRTLRSNDDFRMKRFSGKTFLAGVDYGEEVRGS
jgi:energy-coupling factor transporter ATP-binding protein EcfA2